MQVILIELFPGSSLSRARAQKILLCLNIDRKDYRNSTRSTIDWIFFSKNWPHDTVSQERKMTHQRTNFLYITTYRKKKGVRRSNRSNRHHGLYKRKRLSNPLSQLFNALRQINEKILDKLSQYSLRQIPNSIVRENTQLALK